MKVVFNSNNDKVSDCVEFINDLFEIEMFYDSISNRKEPFTHTEYPPNRISSILKSDNSQITIKLYKSKNPFTKSNAYVSPKYKNTLFLNTRKLWREKPEIIDTIVHECVHVADYSENGQIDFGHGDNYSEGKENSAPYWIGNKAKQFYLDSLKSDIEIEQHDIDESLIVDDKG